MGDNQYQIQVVECQMGDLSPKVGSVNPGERHVVNMCFTLLFDYCPLIQPCHRDYKMEK